MAQSGTARTVWISLVMRRSWLRFPLWAPQRASSEVFVSRLAVTPGWHSNGVRTAASAKRSGAGRPRREVSAGKVTSTATPLSERLTRWLDHVSEQLSPTTVRDYRRACPLNDGPCRRSPTVIGRYLGGRTRTLGTAPPPGPARRRSATRARCVARRSGERISGRMWAGYESAEFAARRTARVRRIRRGGGTRTSRALSASLRGCPRHRPARRRA